MNKEDIKKGARFLNSHCPDPNIYLKVMANEDGYVMARWKGCIPFISPLKEFICRFSAWDLITTHHA